MTQPSEKVGIGFDVDSATLAALVRQFGDLERQTLSYTQKSGEGFSGLIKNVSAFGFQLFGLKQALQPLAQIKQGFESLFSTNIQFENFAAEFKVLLGSVEAAEARIGELSEFARKTPFELPQVVQASKILQTFGGDALATGEGLKMVGDVASGTGVGINELAIYFGRLYDALQSGRPAGEAMQRLQELGAITGETRGQIEAMTKAGADGNEVWAFASQSFERYAGMMEEKSKTVTGGLSNISDGINLMKRDFLQAVFEEIRPAIMSLAEALGDPALQEKARELGTKLGEAVGTIMDAIKEIGQSIDWGALLQAIGNLGTAFEGLFRSIGPGALDAVSMIGQAFSGLVDIFAALPEGAQQMILLAGGVLLLVGHFTKLNPLMMLMPVHLEAIIGATNKWNIALSKGNIAILALTAAVFALDFLIDKVTGKGIFDRIFDTEEGESAANRAAEWWKNTVEGAFRNNQPEFDFMRDQFDALVAQWKTTVAALNVQWTGTQFDLWNEEIPVLIDNMELLESKINEVLTSMVATGQYGELLKIYNEAPPALQAIMDKLINIHAIIGSMIKQQNEVEMDDINALKALRGEVDVHADGMLNKLQAMVVASGDFSGFMAEILGSLDEKGKNALLAWQGEMDATIDNWDEFVTLMNNSTPELKAAFDELSSVAMENLGSIRDNINAILPDVTGDFFEWRDSLYALRDAYEAWNGNLLAMRGTFKEALAGTALDNENSLNLIMDSVIQKGPLYAAEFQKWYAENPGATIETIRATFPALFGGIATDSAYAIAAGGPEMQLAWENTFKKPMEQVLIDSGILSEGEVREIMATMDTTIKNNQPAITSAWENTFKEPLRQVLIDSGFLTETEVNTIMDTMGTTITNKKPEVAAAAKDTTDAIPEAAAGQKDDMTLAGGALAEAVVGGLAVGIEAQRAVIIGIMNTLSAEANLAAQKVVDEYQRIITNTGQYGESTSGTPSGAANSAVGSTNFPGGLTWVGEMGKELVSLPSGSRIFSNREVREKGMGSGGGVTIEMNNVTINASSDAQARASVNGLGFGLFYNLKGRGLI